MISYISCHIQDTSSVHSAPKCIAVDWPWVKQYCWPADPSRTCRLCGGESGLRGEGVEQPHLIHSLISFTSCLMQLISSPAVIMGWQWCMTSWQLQKYLRKTKYGNEKWKINCFDYLVCLFSPLQSEPQRCQPAVCVCICMALYVCVSVSFGTGIMLGLIRFH